MRRILLAALVLGFAGGAHATCINDGNCARFSIAVHPGKVSLSAMAPLLRLTRSSACPRAQVLRLPRAPHSRPVLL